MEFNEETRELSSELGYLRSKITGEFFDHSIFLGIIDNEDNYEELDEEEYKFLLKQMEDK